MKGKTDTLIAEWKADKLWGSLSLCWLATVFASFFGSYLLRITVPGLGSMFLFRFLLPITALLYILWAVRELENPWKGATAVEKWVYVLMGVLFLYGAVSLFWAIDFKHSFSRLFNLCFDLCLIFLMLQLCGRDKRLLRSTLWVSAATALVLAVMGVYESFNGGIFTDKVDGLVTSYFFTLACQYPITTSGNPNDYAAMLLFITAAVFLHWARDPGLLTRVKLWAVILPFPLVLFLIETSSARLCKVGFVLLFIGVLIWFLCQGRWLFWVPAVMLLLVLGVEFSLSKPDSLPLLEQFFNANGELRTSGSAGIRSHLLLHAFDCFRESYGLGVGLGNTETLAAMRAIVPRWADSPQNDIHCFAARIAADYGLFAIVPLCVIAFLLLKRAWGLFATARREKDRSALGFALLFLMIMLSYPFVSTASSDAQDSLSMWIYLAALVLFSVRLEENHKYVRSRN